MSFFFFWLKRWGKKEKRENSIGMIHRRGNIKEAGSAFLADGGMRYLCQQQDTHREREREVHRQRW